MKLGSFTKRIVVKDFTIDLNGGTTKGSAHQPAAGGHRHRRPRRRAGRRPGRPVRHRPVRCLNRRDGRQVTGAQLKLTAVAAGALNAELGTKVFTPGLGVFSARANA